MNLKKIIFVFLFSSVFVAITDASEKFRYNFEENDTLIYTVNINNEFNFPGLGNLASLLNLEGMSQHIDIIVEISVETINSDASANIKAVFRKISMVTITGDRIFTDDGSSWGAVKPGSEYKLVIAPDGRIIDYSGPDSIKAKQGIQIVQRFFPVFPESPIENGHQWTDSLNFELKLPGGKPAEILSQIAYSYIGIDLETGKGVDNNEKNHRFDFNINTVSNDTSHLQLSGKGYFYFDNYAGRIVETSGDYTIDALIDLATFGLPEGLGNGVPVNIKSEVRIKLKDEQ